MEALQTKIDSLQWEVNRLDAENQKLRAQDEEASRRVDLETELEQGKADVAELTKEWQAYKQKVVDLGAAVDIETATALQAEVEQKARDAMLWRRSEGKVKPVRSDWLTR